jgi:hypothetical protein
MLEKIVGLSALLINMEDNHMLNHFIWKKNQIKFPTTTIGSTPFPFGNHLQKATSVRLQSNF